MKIGVVGLGRMGAAMSQRLRDQGFDLVGWDHNAAANQARRGRRVEDRHSARDVAAQSEIVISIITEDHGVRRIFNGPDGFLAGDVKGKLFIEMSTLQPMTGRELAPLVEAKGARLIELPVLGTIPQVRDGKLFALVGGRSEDLERARPVLEKMTRRIAHMGPNGSGYAMKLAVNLGLGAYIQAVSESLALGSSRASRSTRCSTCCRRRPMPAAGSRARSMCSRASRRNDARHPHTAQGSDVGGGDRRALRRADAAVGRDLDLAVGRGCRRSRFGDLAELPKFMRESMLQNFS